MTTKIVRAGIFSFLAMKNTKKKVSLIMLCTALWCGLACAQENQSTKELAPLKLRHRISFSYGDGMGVKLGASYDHFPGFTTFDPVATTGSFNLDYRYIIPSGRWGFGLEMGLTPIISSAYWGQELAYSNVLLNIMPKVQCTYFRSKLVELYGTVSAGVMVSAAPAVGGFCAFAWQFDPIAVRVGSEQIAGFVTLGWGARSIVSAGIQIGL